MNYKFSSNEEHDMALKIACEKFDEIHSKDKQPAWLKYCMRMRQSKNQNGNWVFKIVLTTKFEINPGLKWVWNEDGLDFLVKDDPVTGKRSFVISDGGPPAETVVIFAVEVHADGSAIVLADTDLNLLDGTHYQLNITTELNK